jgi:hypothetical protein
MKGLWVRAALASILVVSCGGKTEPSAGGRCGLGEVHFTMLPFEGADYVTASSGESPTGWLTIASSAGDAIPFELTCLNRSWSCSPCGRKQCLSVVISSVPPAGLGFTWDGSTYPSVANSTCNRIGTDESCTAPECAPAGSYVAHICALPGLYGPDCTSYPCPDTSVCTTVEFALPAAGDDLVATLPRP